MNSRFKLAVILVLFEIASKLALSITPRDDNYYLVAAGFSFFILPFIARTGKDQLVIDILGLALAGLVCQGFGVIFYHSEIPIFIYNWSIGVLLACQFARLFLVRDNDGVDQNNSYVHLLCRFNWQRNSDLC